LIGNSAREADFFNQMPVVLVLAEKVMEREIFWRCFSTGQMRCLHDEQDSLVQDVEEAPAS
jgi:hypothetical protein